MAFLVPKLPSTFPLRHFLSFLMTFRNVFSHRFTILKVGQLSSVIVPSFSYVLVSQGLQVERHTQGSALTLRDILEAMGQAITLALVF